MKPRQFLFLLLVGGVGAVLGCSKATPASDVGAPATPAPKGMQVKSAANALMSPGYHGTGDERAGSKLNGR